MYRLKFLNPPLEKLTILRSSDEAEFFLRVLVDNCLFFLEGREKGIYLPLNSRDFTIHPCSVASYTSLQADQEITRQRATCLV